MGRLPCQTGCPTSKLDGSINDLVQPRRAGVFIQRSSLTLFAPVFGVQIDEDVGDEDAIVE